MTKSVVCVEMGPQTRTRLAPLLNGLNMLDLGMAIDSVTGRTKLSGPSAALRSIFAQRNLPEFTRAVDSAEHTLDARGKSWKQKLKSFATVCATAGAASGGQSWPELLDDCPVDEEIRSVAGYDDAKVTVSHCISFRP